MTFKDIKVIAVAAVRYVIYHLHLVTCSNNIIILHRFQDIIASFRKFKQVMSLFCHPLANISHGQPMYKIWSL